MPCSRKLEGVLLHSPTSQLSAAGGRKQPENIDFPPGRAFVHCPSWPSFVISHLRIVTVLLVEQERLLEQIKYCWWNHCDEVAAMGHSRLLQETDSRETDVG
jgi:hypothetical protein